MMRSFPESMQEYRKQLQRGYLQVAYRGLMEYFRHLRTHFKRNYPEVPVSGSLYYGTMDMTYFALMPKSLKSRKLKIAIVFLYDTFRFEVWLSGANRDVQAETWQRVKTAGWEKFALAADPRAVDFVLAHTLVEDPDFADLDALTGEIERGTLEFLEEVEEFLARVKD